MAAGVARGTVSRVINGAPDVAPALRDRVLEAVAAVGYVPNHAARALVTGRTGMVAVVVGEDTDRLLSDPFYSRVMLGMMDGLTPYRLHQILMMAKSPEARADTERYLMERHVDGAMLLSQHGDDPLPGMLEAVGLPFVMGGRPLVDHETSRARSFVDFDNEGGAYAATGHLLARGRRAIATITGPLDTSVAVARRAGYRRRLEHEGLRAQPRAEVEGDFSTPSGARAMARLLEVYPELDAVFVANDTMALGAMEVLRERRIAVPTQVALVGFDDSETAKHTSPPLTSVRQDEIEMGRQMARLLAGQISGSSDGRRQLILETQLIVRSTS